MLQTAETKDFCALTLCATMIGGADCGPPQDTAVLLRQRRPSESGPDLPTVLIGRWSEPAGCVTRSSEGRNIGPVTLVANSQGLGGVYRKCPSPVVMTAIDRTRFHVARQLQHEEENSNNISLPIGEPQSLASQPTSSIASSILKGPALLLDALTPFTLAKGTTRT